MLIARKRAKVYYNHTPRIFFERMVIMTYRASIVPLRDEENTVYMEFMERKHFTSRDWKQLMSMVLSFAIDYDRMTITVINVDTGKFCFAFHTYTQEVDSSGFCDSRIICDVYACDERFNHIRTVVLAE